MPTIEANGITLAYTLHHPATPNPLPWVVLINGLADPMETWSAQIPPLLAAHHPVLTFDNRGIGASSCPAGPYTASLLAADAKALVTALHLPRFHLLGVSMGGMVAQTYALHYRADLLSLTLACTYAAPGPFCSRMFAVWADAAPVMGVPFVMREVLLWAFTVGFFTDPSKAEMVKGVEDGMRFMDQSVHAYLSQLNVIREFDVRGEIGGIRGLPTLVLAGEEDILIPVSLSKEVHGLIGGSQWVTVRGGHGCLWEFPDEFNKAFVQFLGSVKQVD